MAAIALSGCGKASAPEQVEVRRPERMVRRAVAQPGEGPAADAERAGALARTDLPSSDEADEQGLIFKNERVPDGPWSINVLKVDRSRKDLCLTTTTGRSHAIGLGPLTEQLAAVPPELGQPIAAINGDFYRTEQEPYSGDPRGLQIMRGELISAPIGKTSFWVDAEGNPTLANVTSRFSVTWPGGATTAFGLNEERHGNDVVLYTPRAGASTRTSGGREFILIPSGQATPFFLRPGRTYTMEVREVREGGNTRLRGDILVLSVGPLLLNRVESVTVGATLQLSTQTSPDLTGVEVAVGGGPVLVHEGRVQPANANKSRERHPRSAFGWNENYFFLAEVDGRQHGFSVGMTLPELASYLVKQGCREAMNLDGGGSAEMWVEGQIVNRPCFGYERNTANGLVVVRKAKPVAPETR